uniref:Lon proteolytic domain-containing protein n=1 Tax=Meloidogyne incognita TaxID=6306 RepID=A0A914N4N0_MELIC
MLFFVLAILALFVIIFIGCVIYNLFKKWRAQYGRMLAIPVLVVTKNDFVDAGDEIEKIGLCLGFINLNSMDKVEELSELVHQFIVSKNILYTPDDSSRCYCMKKLKNGNVQIFMNRIGRVGDLLGSGSGKEYILLVDDHFPTAVELENFGLDLTQSSIEDDFFFNQPDNIEATAAFDPNKNTEKIYETTPIGVYPFVTTFKPEDSTFSGRGAFSYAEITEQPSAKFSVLVTGNCSLVFIESVLNAYTYLCTYDKWFLMRKFKAHFLPAATKKDGPSAGGAIAMAFMSVRLNKPAKQDTVVFGELTQKGILVPVGGLREKLMAARRNEIKTIIFPTMMQSDWDALSTEEKEGFEVHFCYKIKDAINIVFPKDQTEERERQEFNGNET